MGHPRHGASAAIAARASSKTTSYALPASHRSRSCWVAGIVKPSGPATGALNPSNSAGAARRADRATAPAGSPPRD